MRLCDFCDLGIQVGNAGPVDIGIVDIGGGDLRLRDGRDLCGQFADVRPVDIGLFNIGGGDLCHGNGGQSGIELVRSDVLRGQFLYLCGDRRNGRGVQFAYGRFSDFCLRDGRVLNVCGLNRRHLHLQAAHRAGLQLAAAHGIERQLAAGNHAGRELARGDHTAFQRIRRRAERHRSILSGQAIVGILRHAHGNFHANAPSYDAHAVAEKNIRERDILLIFFGIRAIHEIHLQGDRGKVAARVKLGLRCLTHFGIALRLAFRLIAVCDLPGFRYRQMNPFRVGIGIEVWAVDIEFRQIQDVPVCIFAGGHDAGNHVRFVYVVRYTDQVLPFPDRYVGIVAHALHQKHIVPVAGQFRAVLVDQTVFTQHGFHGIDVFPFHILRS